ncbi:MAG: phage protease, partial [Thermotogae bacterium]|nr:phage protease [Thermotogota bacterium]
MLNTVELSDTAWINILPIGVIYDRRYGKVVVDKALIDKMISNYKAGIPAYQLSVDLDHEGGKAYGWIKGLETRDDGLYALVEFNQDGSNLIKEGEY